MLVHASQRVHEYHQCDALAVKAHQIHEGVPPFGTPFGTALSNQGGMRDLKSSAPDCLCVRRGP